MWKKTDLCVLIATWLNNNDIPWIDDSDLNNDGYTMDNSLRNSGKRGGGLAIIYKDSLEIKKIEEKHANTYQSARWKASVKNTHNIYILGIYRLPQSDAATSISNFTEKFLEDVQDDVIPCANLVILGDLNIHINDQNDNETQSFID